MTALITVWRDGTAISCGRSCYSAKHKACRCPICGGLNHGKGPEVAAAITRRHLPEWVAAAGEGAEVELDPSVQQDPLFLIGDQAVPDSPSIFDYVTEAITYHPGNRTGAMIASDVLRTIRERLQYLLDTEDFSDDHLGVQRVIELLEEP